MLRSFIIFTTIFISICFNTFAQEKTDSTKTYQSSPITVEAVRYPRDIQRLAPVSGTFIFSGKKSEVVILAEKDIPASEKYARQIFAKIPGVFVYDMDGTGNQMNISTRGLDPHRGWEFNIRKDGILTNSDMYGYPASHYNIPMEAVERIELVRGTSALQYGAQFGGMLNYISKQPDTTRKIAFQSINTVGSYGLVSTHNAISGKLGKFRYSAWVNRKHNGGYRKNGDSEYDAENLTLFYDASRQLSFKAEFTRSSYLAHLPGALNDSMFHADPQMSTRSRNYFNPSINIPSLGINYSISNDTKLQLNLSYLFGDRNSVMFDRLVNINDTIVPTTLEYNNRQIDIDNFGSFTAEFRAIHSYSTLGTASTLAVGFQYMNNDLHRRQLGKGTTGTDFNMTLVEPGWGRDMHYKTSNIAFFAENRWTPIEDLSVTAGVRVESGESDFSGKLTYYPSENVPNTIKHSFPLFAVSAQYNLNDFINIYGGWGQAYRPVILKDIIPGSIYEVADKNLKDASGYTAEAGIRGAWNVFTWDISAFAIQYNNRLGTQVLTDSNHNTIFFRTNIGNSFTKGIEALIQADFALADNAVLSIFTSTSYMDARYKNAFIRSGNQNISIDGNYVESVPQIISRNGASIIFGAFKISLMASYVGDSYADALNTELPSANGAVGLVPAYTLFDANFSIRFNDTLKLRVNASNITNENYFTKRPQFYPGPGIWPSDGRTFSATALISI